MAQCRTRRRLGDFGEAVAAAYLTRQGYVVLEQQWRCAVGEIDVIARAGDDLVFVEVRTRRGAAYGQPEESVNRAKQTRLMTLAYAYLEAQGLEDATPWRIDVIALEIDGAGRVRRLNHIINAVEA